MSSPPSSCRAASARRTGYVAGFLIPTGTPPDRSADADEDDDLDTIPESAGLPEESNDERKAGA